MTLSSSRRTLILNASYEPLGVLTARRAIVLVLLEKADVVHDAGDGAVVRSERMALDVPSVIRLRYYVRVPHRVTMPLSRRAVMRRDRGRCGYCLAPADTIDHIVPRSRGGLHEWTNVVASCRRHNAEKGNRLLSELGWKLRIKPSVPSRSLSWLVASNGVVDDSWVPYIDLTREHSHELTHDLAHDLAHDDDPGDEWPADAAAAV